MTYQAGQRNFQVATGADNIFAVRFHRQGDLVDASTLVAGDYIVYDGTIWPVFSTTAAGTGKTTFKLGHGAFYEPELTLNDDDQVPTAPAAIWEATDMQVALPDTTTRRHRRRWPCRHRSSTTAPVCLIEIDQTWLEPFQRAIDYSERRPVRHVVAV